MSVYYNENDPAAASWLRELIARGALPPGDVDTRSIWDVAPDDLRPYRQHHFFAGIGGWAHALALAGWPRNRAVWTGSCPCQPFSAAGRGRGAADERHLWPAWFHLIRECRPAVIFGEQVDAAVRHGWVDLVHADLEAEDYACGWVDLPAACVGASHIRQRLWFVADGDRERRQQISRGASGDEGPDGWGPVGDHVAAGHGEADGSAHDHEAGRESGSRDHFWSACDWLPCRDGKYRPVEPGTFPLAHGVPARVGRLRGYGNAIVPHVAAEVIRAYMEVRS